MGSLFTKRKSPTLVSEAVQTDLSFKDNSSPMQILPDPRSATREIIRTPMFVKVKKDELEDSLPRGTLKKPYLETDIDAVEYLPDRREYAMLSPLPDQLYAHAQLCRVDEVHANMDAVLIEGEEELAEENGVEIFVDDSLSERMPVEDKAYIENETHGHFLLPKRLTFSPAPVHLTSNKFVRTPLRVVDENIIACDCEYNSVRTWRESQHPVKKTPSYRPMWDQENSLFI